MVENPEALFKQISHGVYVIGVTDGLQQNAFTAAWVMQVSFNPPLLALSINPAYYSYQLLQKGEAFSVNVLGDHQYTTAAHFGNSSADKMKGYAWQKDTTGAPILSDALAYFDCKVRDTTPAGDHIIVIGEIISIGKLNPGKPLLYQQTDTMDNSKDLYA